ncbi:C6 transcription factor [Histoplasma capsulatum]|uniref:C6 transcription factor n=1 Tax=Ajellomyces capsulatus TaxID=5037 RepID=A0A8A1M377_AJECA|nr:C6 transcription factor [Histoplasma capsulatum]
MSSSRSPESQATNATPAYAPHPHASDDAAGDRGGGGDASSRAASSSHDQPAESSHRKRRRRTIACAPCRNRKVKCDFGYPACNRCMKGPGPEACMYESPVHALQHQQQQQQQQQQQEQQRQRQFSHPPAPAPVSAAASASSAFWHPRPPEANWPNAHAPAVAASEEQQSDDVRVRELRLIIQSLIQQQSNSPFNNAAPLSTKPDQHPHPHPHPYPGSTAAGPADASARDDLSVQAEPWGRDAPNRHRFDGNEGRTRFWGCSNGSKLSFELEGLSSFMKDLKATASLRALHQEIRKVGYNKQQKPLSGELATDSLFLKSLLPVRPVVENLVNCYFSYVGKMHPILHRPSFRAQLNDLWAEKVDIPCHFIVQLLLVMASVWSVNTPSPLTASGTKILSHTVATEWIRWSEAWLFHANIKRPNLVVLQVRCLLIMAKEANYTQKNQAWSSAGTLVKLAMSAGCHREPPPETKISAFNREMRRRIWATILELDLQASLDRGMPPTMQQSDYDCSPPLNIDDEDLCENITVSPEEKPTTTMTDCSFQVALMQSMGLRLRICALVNAPRISLSSNDLSLLEEEINRSLSDIPDWQDNTTPNPPEASHSFMTQKQQKLLWRTLLESNLRRCQLSLYTYSVLGGLKGSINCHTTQARLEVAVVILCQQQLLIDNIGKLAWCALADVTFHAAFTICHHLHASDCGFTSAIVRQVIPSITDILISLVQKTLSWLEEKFLVLEKGMREYYFLCVSITLVKTKLWPESASTFQQQAADRLRIMSYNLFAKYLGENAGIHEESRTHDSQQPSLVVHGATPQSISSVSPEHLFPGHSVLVDEIIGFGGFEDWDWFNYFGGTFPGPERM